MIEVIDKIGPGLFLAFFILLLFYTPYLYISLQNKIDIQKTKAGVLASADSRLEELEEKIADESQYWVDRRKETLEDLEELRDEIDELKSFKVKNFNFGDLNLKLNPELKNDKKT